MPPSRETSAVGAYILPDVNPHSHHNNNNNSIHTDNATPLHPSTANLVDGVVERIFTPTCVKCGAVYTTPYGQFPPVQWECTAKGCGGKLWQPDGSSNVCDICKTPVARFTRHHCRRCGYLTCASCLSFTTIFPTWSANEKQRVCCRCSVPTVPVRMSGWLLKLGQRSVFFEEKTLARFFELRGTFLLYGTSPSEAGDKGNEQNGENNSCPSNTPPTPSTPLTDHSRTDNGENSTRHAHDTTGKGSSVYRDAAPHSTMRGLIDITGAKVMDVSIHPNAFCLVGPRLARGYVFSAPTPADKTRWVEAIKEQVAHARKEAKRHQQQREAKEEYIRTADEEDDSEEAIDHTEEMLYASNETYDSRVVSVRDFELLTVIGLGGFGRVMRVRHRATGNIYAMKILDKVQVIQHHMVSSTHAEKLILSKISHPFVVRLYYAFQTRQHLILILEFLCGGELLFHLQRSRGFSENRARFYAAEIGCALAHLHVHRVLYRDLKPENLVLDRDGHVVLTDFGLGKLNGVHHNGNPNPTTTSSGGNGHHNDSDNNERTRGDGGDVNVDDRTYTFCGTPGYMAPELISRAGHTTAVDWWSLGVFIYEMVHGVLPFYSKNTREMYEMILHKPLVCPPSFSPELRSLLERLLEKDPAKRMTTGEEFRAHPFFASIDFEKLLRREIRPDFVPDVRRNDLRYFDKQFLQESTRVAQLDQPFDPSDPASRAFAGYEFNAYSPTDTPVKKETEEVEVQ